MIFPWTEIESFHNVRKYTKEHPEILNGNGTVVYAAKVKLHGTNAGIQCHNDGRVIAQSRTTELVEGNDNAGFAKWVLEHEDYWRIHNDLVIYGEWCGPGIQKGVAISEIPRRIFAIFAARRMTDNLDELIIEPEKLKEFVSGCPDTHVLPWYHEVREHINWNNPAEVLQKQVNYINQQVIAVETNDPWVEATFGVKGTGEGLVFYPVSKEHLGLANYNNLVFKAKGEKHKNIKTAAPAQVDASAAANVSQFVDMVLTDARLEQGTKAVCDIVAKDGSLLFDLKLVGKFIAWITTDVQKETQDELTASNLTWKQVMKSIGDKARTWYLAKAKQL